MAQSSSGIMSALILKANKLNQNFNSIFFKTIPIMFDSKNNEWIYEDNWWTMLPFCFMNLVIILLCGSMKLVFLTTVMIIIPEILSVNQKIAALLSSGVVIPLAFVMIFVMYHYGNEITVVANWSVNVKRSFNIPPHYNYDSGLLALIKSGRQFFLNIPLSKFN